MYRGALSGPQECGGNPDPRALGRVISFRALPGAAPRSGKEACLDHRGSLLTVSLLQAALLRLFTTHGLTLANLGSLRLRPHSQPLPSPLWTPISQLP